ncbi:MAG: NAD-dependent epimerase/dehydratase family protein, partial [Anaerolineae bacterium]
MNILITGGSGFIGRHLTQSLLADGHQVWILSRAPQKMSVRPGIHPVGWDGRSDAGWGHLVNEMDAIVNLAGKSLASWPWTAATKQAFWDSRIRPGEALVAAIQKADRRPRVLLQSSGMNHYGLHGDLADESTPPADDFLARLTVAWEASTRAVEDLGVRRVIIRSAVVLARQGG